MHCLSESDIFYNSIFLDGFPVDKDVFDEYLYDFIHTSGFGDAYKVYIDVKNSSGVDIDVSTVNI